MSTTYKTVSLVLAMALVSNAPVLAQRSDSSAAPQVVAQEAKRLSDIAQRFELGEELILNFRVDTFDYGEIFAVVQPNGLYVAPEEFFDLLRFPIEASPALNNGFSGWFIREDLTFALEWDLDPSNDVAGVVSLSGQSKPIANADYLEIGNQSLVNLDVMAAWFGISLALDTQNLAIEATPSIPLPAQEKLLRDRRKVSKRGLNPPRYPNYDFGYFGRSHQMFDSSINTKYNNDSFSSFYSVVGVQDLFGLSTRFFARGDDKDWLRDAQVTFKRQAPQGGLLGLLDATSVEFGDIRPVRSGGVTGQKSIGVNISNGSLGRVYDYEFTNISGLIAEGWDIELYHNGVLVKKQLNTLGGDYEFLDLPLYGGLNKFEVVKYGPQGQVEREIIERNLDANLFRSGPRYNIALTRSNSALLARDTLDEEKPQDWLLTGSYQYAFSDWLSSNFNHSINLSDSEAVNNYSVGMGARLSPRLLSTLSYGYQDNNTHSLSVGLQSQLFNQLMNLRAGRVDTEGETVSQFVALDMSGSLLSQSDYQFFYNNEYQGIKQGEDTSHNLSNTLTFSTRWGTLSHYLSHVVSEQDDQRETTTTGGLSLGMTKGLLYVNAYTDYQLDDQDQLEWTNARVSANYQISDTLTANMQLSHSLLSDLDTLQLGLDWRKEKFSLASRLNYNSEGDLGIQFNARVSMSETPFGKGYVSSSRTLTGKGLIAVRVFEDLNHNMIYDDTDRPIANAKVKAPQFNKTATTDGDGIALFKGVRSFQATDIELIEDSLDDPYLLQSTISTAVTPREGLLSLINYPLIQGVELEGEVTVLMSDGETQAVRAAPIHIYNSQGEKVKTLRTEFDGYYYSGILYPDEYHLEIDENYLQAKLMENPKAVKVIANKPGDLVVGVDFTLKPFELVRGYQPILAKFNTKRAALAYMSLMADRASLDRGNMQPKLVFNHSSNNYLVGYGIYQSEAPARNFCNRLKSKGLSCQIHQDDYKYSAQQ